jgi:hypothetical protein
MICEIRVQKRAVYWRSAVESAVGFLEVAEPVGDPIAAAEPCAVCDASHIDHFV